MPSAIEKYIVSLKLEVEMPEGFVTVIRVVSTHQLPVEVPVAFQKVLSHLYSVHFLYIVIDFTAI